MESDELIYRKLQKHLDRMPVGFPESKNGNDVKILKELFTPEEAEIALELSMLPEPAAKIYPRLKNIVKDVEELEEKLDDMLKKGLILGGKLLSKDKGVRFYSNAQLCIGIYEFQVDRMNSTMARTFENYFDQDFITEFENKDTIPQLHTIPIEKSVIRENFSETYDNVRKIIEDVVGPIVLRNCICKQTNDLLGSECKTTKNRETCITLRSIALHNIELGEGRIVSKEEIFKLLEEAEKDGLVVQPQNSKKPEAICLCCGCCCLVFKMIKKYPKPAEYYSSNYFASVDSELCAGCGTCTTRCQMDAISIIDEKAVVDLDRCIGCGLCTTTCKTGAAVLNRKDNTVEPPKNHGELYKRILMKKIGPFGAIKTMVKYKLGMKV